MTDPYTEARNASAGMPGHSMSADVGVREAGGDKLREALLRIARMLPGVYCSDECSDEFLAMLPDEFAHYQLTRALNAPTESAKAPEGVTQRSREILAAEWGDSSQWAEVRERILDGSCIVHSDPLSLSSAIALSAMDKLAASPTPITADDAVAKERERKQIAYIIDPECGLSAWRQLNRSMWMERERVALEKADRILAAIRSLSPDTEGEG